MQFLTYLLKTIERILTSGVRFLFVSGNKPVQGGFVVPYILIEGVDGSGKDTQADLLVHRLEQQGEAPVRVTEPCDDLPTGKLLRKLLKSGEYKEAHAPLFLADRMALHSSVVAPALEEGQTVISVRSFLSTLVYQQENWDLDWLISLHSRMLVKPDVIVWLDLDPNEGLNRVQLRGGAKDVYERLDIQTRNRERYASLLEGDPPSISPLCANDIQVVRVDASQSRRAVHEQIWEALCLKR